MMGLNKMCSFAQKYRIAILHCNHLKKLILLCEGLDDNALRIDWDVYDGFE